MLIDMQGKRDRTPIQFPVASPTHPGETMENIHLSPTCIFDLLPHEVKNLRVILVWQEQLQILRNAENLHPWSKFQ